MVNDRPHFAFSLVSARHLPLTGDEHPLRREFERWLATGHVLTLLVVSAAFALWNAGERLHAVEPPGEQTVVTLEYPPSPRSIRPESPHAVVGGDVLTPRSIPDPVPVLSDEVPNDEATDPGTGGPGGPSSDGTEGPYSGLDSIAPPKPVAASGDYIWFTELPVLISIEAPVYPRIVREAGIEGAVDVRVLVGTDGRVKEAFVVEGSPVLYAAALASARTAVFRPALQGTRPVAVWIVIPVVFRLYGGR